jgi:hypothetical protein
MHVVAFIATQVDDQERRRSMPEAPTAGSSPHTNAPYTPQPAINNPILNQAFASGASNVQLQGYGVVKKVLSDDYEGDRHQRFILDVGGNHTILVAHNIDLAPRIPSIREGDSVEFFGEYEWKPQGGVIHWTHRDPRRRHVPGWLNHNGRVYQ